MKSINRDQRGSILPMFAVVITVIFMVAAVAVDFSRYVLASEKLQTAADSAATAAAMTAKRYVRMEIDPGRYRDCCSDGEGRCKPCCKDCGDKFEITGREDDLIDKRGYRRYCCSCGCGKVEIIDRWVRFEGGGADARMAAELFFNLNKPVEMEESTGGQAEISMVNVRGSRSDPLYPSVIVTAEGRVKTLMMDFMDRMYPGTDLSSMGATRCAQGGSFYYDLDGKWHRAAREGCD
ncbi:MAG: TadE/TadG family type IV pilus assembly protein [Desulfocucumaceae bacterium]